MPWASPGSIVRIESEEIWALGGGRQGYAIASSGNRGDWVFVSSMNLSRVSWLKNSEGVFNFFERRQVSGKVVSDGSFIHQRIKGGFVQETITQSLFF